MELVHYAIRDVRTMTRDTRIIGAFFSQRDSTGRIYHEISDMSRPHDDMIVDAQYHDRLQNAIVYFENYCRELGQVTTRHALCKRASAGVSGSRFF